MKLCLVKVVIMFIITSYKGLAGGECTTNYSVSHNRQRPVYKYRIDYIRDDSATPETCWDYCNQDVACRSVAYYIYGYERWCYKFSISIQQLKDTERDDEIYTLADTYWYLTLITYDRDCVNATSNTTLTTTPTTTTTSPTTTTTTPTTTTTTPTTTTTTPTTTTTTPTTTTMLPDYMCTYPVSHDREAPQWQLFHIDDDFLRDDNATNETCWDYCNMAENCRSAQLIIHGDGRHYCYRYNISVQDLKDTGRYMDIFTQTNTNWAPTYITYDRDCAECTYPVSHAWERPDWNYIIAWKQDDNPTLKTCQAMCNKDVFCRSVGYDINGHRRTCDKYSISLQELKDSGRDNEIYNFGISSAITYDKQCAAPPSITCSNTYPVSHDRESPDRDYHIDSKLDDNATFKTCQDWCNEDVNCKSVTYRIRYYWGRYCDKYRIRAQELKDMGKYSMIYTYTDTDKYPTYITYDRYCECPPGLEPSSLLLDFCTPCSPGFFKPSRGSEKCIICVDGEVSKNKTSCVEVSPTTEGPGTDGDEVSPCTNAAAIGEPMIVLIMMIGAGAVFVAPMLPGAEIAL